MQIELQDALKAGGGGTFHIDQSKGKTAMKGKKQLTAIIEREDDGYVSLCPEIDIASQGDTIEEARKNLVEALELFFETADAEEIKGRLIHAKNSENNRNSYYFEATRAR